MQISPSSPLAGMPPSQQAQEALASMPATADDSGTRRTGDRYLGSIESVTSGAERTVAATVRSAAQQSLRHESAITAQRIALQTLAAGVTGAPTMALAQVGEKILPTVTDLANARQIGYSILQGVVDNADDPREKTLAQAVYDVSGAMLTHQSGIETQRAGLALIASAAYTDPTALMKFGLAATHGAATAADSATIARAVIDRLDGSGLRASEVTLLEAVKGAGDACEDKDTVAVVYEDALKMLGDDQPQSSDRLLASFGLAARSHANWEDSRMMGKSVLEKIAATTTDVKVKEIARKAVKNSDPSRLGLWDRIRGVEPEAKVAEVQKTALNSILTATPFIEKKKKAEMMDELKKMAEGDEEAAKKAGTVQIEDDTIVIGGVRITKKRVAADTPTSTA